MANASVFAPDDHVASNWQASADDSGKLVRPEYCVARIVAFDSESSTYTLQYDDGQLEVGVFPTLICAVKSVPKYANLLDPRVPAYTNAGQIGPNCALCCTDGSEFACDRCKVHIHAEHYGTTVAQIERHSKTQYYCQRCRSSGWSVNKSAKERLQVTSEPVSSYECVFCPLGHQARCGPFIRTHDDVCKGGWAHVLCAASIDGVEIEWPGLNPLSSPTAADAAASAGTSSGKAKTSRKIDGGYGGGWVRWKPGLLGTSKELERARLKLSKRFGAPCEICVRDGWRERATVGATITCSAHLSSKDEVLKERLEQEACASSSGGPKKKTHVSGSRSSRDHGPSAGGGSVHSGSRASGDGASSAHPGSVADTGSVTDSDTALAQVGSSGEGGKKPVLRIQLPDEEACTHTFHASCAQMEGYHTFYERKRIDGRVSRGGACHKYCLAHSRKRNAVVYEARARTLPPDRARPYLAIPAGTLELNRRPVSQSSAADRQPVFNAANAWIYDGLRIPFVDRPAGAPPPSTSSAAGAPVPSSAAAAGGTLPGLAGALHGDGAAAATGGFGAAKQGSHKRQRDSSSSNEAAVWNEVFGNDDGDGAARPNAASSTAGASAPAAGIGSSLRGSAKAARLGAPDGSPTTSSGGALGSTSATGAGAFNQGYSSSAAASAPGADSSAAALADRQHLLDALANVNSDDNDGGDGGGLGTDGEVNDRGTGEAFEDEWDAIAAGPGYDVSAHLLILFGPGATCRHGTPWPLINETSCPRGRGMCWNEVHQAVFLQLTRLRGRAEAFNCSCACTDEYRTRSTTHGSSGGSAGQGYGRRTGGGFAAAVTSSSSSSAPAASSASAAAASSDPSPHPIDKCNPNCLNVAARRVAWFALARRLLVGSLQQLLQSQTQPAGAGAVVEHHETAAAPGNAPSTPHGLLREQYRQLVVDVAWLAEHRVDRGTYPRGGSGGSGLTQGGSDKGTGAGAPASDGGASSASASCSSSAGQHALTASCTSGVANSSIASGSCSSSTNYRGRVAGCACICHTDLEGNTAGIHPGAFRIVLADIKRALRDSLHAVQYEKPRKRGANERRRTLGTEVDAFINEAQGMDQHGRGKHGGGLVETLAQRLASAVCEVAAARFTPQAYYRTRCRPELLQEVLMASISKPEVLFPLLVGESDRRRLEAAGASSASASAGAASSPASAGAGGASSSAAAGVGAGGSAATAPQQSPAPGRGEPEARHDLTAAYGACDYVELLASYLLAA